VIVHFLTSAEEGRDDSKYRMYEGGEMMIVVNFWTLNQNVPPSKIAEVAAQLMQKGLYPPKHTKVLGFYVCPGGRGVTVTEIEGASADEAAFEDWVMWVKECPGMFASFESYPALAAEKAVEITLK
jgi:hypothetical protein